MPIPYSMLSIISAAVDAMSVSGGDNFDYGPVDIFDPARRIYPQVYLEYTDESPAGTQMAGHTTQGIDLTFRVLIAKGAGAIDAEIAKVLDDVKRLINSLQASLSAVGVLYIDPVSAHWEPRLVAAYPAQLSATFRFVYRQLRANPASP